MLDSDVAALEQALLEMDRAAAKRIFCARAEAAGTLAAMETLMTAALQGLGERWEQGSCALSQIYMAGKICEELSLSFLSETSEARLHAPKIALAVFEDRHVLGKRMVQAVLLGSGYHVSDWGFASRVSVLKKLDETPVDVLMLSTLMLSSALQIRELCSDLARLPRRPLVIVGGAPFRMDARLWREVGADAMGIDASDAPRLLSDLVIRGQLSGDRA